MNRKIKLKTKSYNYDILIGKGQTEKFLSSLNKSNNKKYLLIDKKIYNNYKNLFNKLSKKNFFIITITGNEKLKSFSYYIRISSILLSKKIDRSSWIVAIGGGTIGDISGFIASTIMRGVKL